MKKKPHEHPKLFLDTVIDDDGMYLLFKQNNLFTGKGRTQPFLIDLLNNFLEGIM